MGPRAEPIVPRPLGTPNLRPRRLNTVLWDVEPNPGPPTTDWGEEDNSVVPDLVAEACGRLGISPVRDAFATPANHRFPAYLTREDDAFAQPWDYATAGPLWANPPFSRLEEVVAKAAREGCLMLVIAPEWPGPQYPWWAALCALYLRGVHGSDASPQVEDMGLPARPPGGVTATHAPTTPAPSHSPTVGPLCRRQPGIGNRAPNS